MKPSSLPAVAVNDATILIDVIEAGILDAMLDLPVAECERRLRAWEKRP